MSIAENPYATPQSRLSWMPVRQPMFLVVAPRKFLSMVLLTLGGYFAYWLYRQWTLYQQATGKRLWPWVRVLFPACYFCSLILRVMQELEQGESTYHWWPRCLAVMIFVCGCLPFTMLWLLSPFAALAVAACIAVLQVALALQLQCAINHLERDPEGEGNACLTRANWLGIAGGLLGWGLLVTAGVWGAG
ncbi:hypothetical protein [Pseudomonas cedrina]|uniref:hypothetical protein n=1 Tax=Pseudomonas cedrina TaxID=651740 RepID=UPI00278999BB|nr:hypothetical protein [Pseudomonas cedrina]MDQ0651414.1 hypothetical protein [Pseudomonas cedrina]